MPSRNAAYKAIRADGRKRKRNNAIASALKTEMKKMDGLIADKKKDKAMQYLKVFEAKYMKAASKGIIHKKTASRKISRMFKRVNRLK